MWSHNLKPLLTIDAELEDHLKNIEIIRALDGETNKLHSK